MDIPVDVLSKLLYLRYIAYLVDHRRNSRYVKTGIKKYTPSKLSLCNSF
jgi:hypothetical protein